MISFLLKSRVAFAERLRSSDKQHQQIVLVCPNSQTSQSSPVIIIDKTRDEHKLESKYKCAIKNNLTKTKNVTVNMGSKLEA